MSVHGSVLGVGAAHVRRAGKPVWCNQSAIDAAKRHFATTGLPVRCIVQAFADARPCRPDETDLSAGAGLGLYRCEGIPDAVFVARDAGHRWEVLAVEWRTAGSRAAATAATAVRVTRVPAGADGGEYPAALWVDDYYPDPVEARNVLVDRKRAAERWLRANPDDPRRPDVVERMHVVEDLIRRAKADAGRADPLAEKVRELERRLALVECKVLGGVT